MSSNTNNDNLITYEKQEEMTSVHVLKIPANIYDQFCRSYRAALKEMDVVSDAHLNELIMIDATEIYRVRFKVERVE